MKTTKIIMGIAAAAVVALTGCKGVGAGLGDAAISYSPKVNAEINAEATATVTHTNDTDEYARGLLQFANKKKGITANLVIKDLDSNAANPGLIGFAFDMKKNSDGTWNFCTVGVKNTNGTAYSFVYYYKNVAEADLTKQDFGKTGSADEVPIVTMRPITGVTRRADNTLQVVVEIEALKADASEANGDEEEYSVDATNAFAIRFYETPANGDLVGFKGLSNKATEAKNAIHETAINKDSVWYVTREKIDYSKSAAPLEKMAFYANVYAKKTLNAEWQIADMKNNPNVMKSAEGEKTYGDFDIVFVE